MPDLPIRIARKSQKEPVFPEMQDAFGGELKICGAAVLEKGMITGKTSVGFVVTDGQKYFLCQTSAAIIEALMDVIKGAEANWAENPE